MRGRRHLVAPMMGAALGVLLVACGERAPNERIVVQRGGDLIGSGNELEVRDSVTGDVMLAAGEIAFSGTAGGDYIGAGGDQRVGGIITGSARIAAGNVVVSSAIGRNATIASGNLELLERGTIGGNAYFAAGNVEVAGRVTGLLRVASGTVEISGSTGGDVHVSAGRLRVGPTARIEGDLRYSVPEENVQIDSSAVITGRLIALPVRDWSRVRLLLRLGVALGFLLAGAVLVALFPTFAARVADNLLSRPGVSAGFGVLWVVMLPIVIGIAAVSLIGIPLALLLGGAYLIILYLSGIVLALALGILALRAWARRGRGRLVAAFLLGGIALVVLTWIPYIGGFAVLCAFVLGSGALMMPVVRRAEV